MKHRVVHRLRPPPTSFLVTHSRRPEPVNNPPPPRRGEFGQPPLQAPHSTALRFVACCALRSGCPNSSPFPLHP